MNEEELQAKAKELEEREGELTKKEEELNAREERLAAREADAASIAQKIKDEFEKKLAQRDEVIRQLASGDAPLDDNSPFAELNKRRLAQKAA